MVGVLALDVICARSLANQHSAPYVSRKAVIASTADKPPQSTYFVSNIPFGDWTPTFESSGAMLRNVVLRQNFLPLESIQLGRLVLNVDEPQQDYFDPPCDQEPEVIITHQTGYSGTHQTTADRNLTAVLIGLVSASRNRRNRTFTEVESDRATTYRLGNSGLWFKNAVKADATRKWIEQAMDDGDSIYMVVGYHTLMDARVVEGIAGVSGNNVQIGVPPSVAITGAPAPIGHIANPGIVGHQQQGQRVQSQFVATGERICAVQYRKVRYKWFSSRDQGVELAKETRWKMDWDIRGQEGGVNDILETELQDELELEDDYETYTSEADGMFLY